MFRRRSHLLGEAADSASSLSLMPSNSFSFLCRSDQCPSRFFLYFKHLICTKFKIRLQFFKLCYRVLGRWGMETQSTVIFSMANHSLCLSKGLVHRHLHYFNSLWQVTLCLFPTIFSNKIYLIVGWVILWCVIKTNIYNFY